MTTYRGRCHCGAVRFAFRAEQPITTGVRCNCSLCIRRGAVMSSMWVAPEAFEELEGLDRLTVYQWGDRDMHHYFCATCGIFPFSEVVEKPGRYRVNLGCVDELDVLGLDVAMIDGRSL
jgi:hypothetical protein